jgi:hypothetical protein
VEAQNQIAVATEDIPETTVITPSGLFEFLCMPFGLRNSAQNLQRFIIYIIDSAYVYLDGILVASSSVEEHF